MAYIPSATDVWQSQKKNDYEKSVQSVLRAIQIASEQGYRKTNFNPYDYRYYDAIKREFESKGYYFTPTGYVGGVWQRTEDINW